MLKPYNELRKIDVTPYCDERDGILYLNWARCVALLHENGAEIVDWDPVTNEHTMSSLIASEQTFTDKNGMTNRCYETRIIIKIDDKEYPMQAPIMNGANPVKDNSMSQQRLWNSQCRAFVKGVAIHTDLGFDLWLKEENELQKSQKEEDVHHDILKVRERVFETVTGIMKKTGMSEDQLAEKMGKSFEEFKTTLLQYVVLARFEETLINIAKELQ